MRKIFAGVLCLLVMAACGRQAGQDAVVLTSGIELANMDTTVRPQDDFFRYVNGTWLATTEIPADRNNTGVFMDLRDKAREDVKTIIEEVAAKTDLEPGSDEQKVADLYNSFMDTARLEELGSVAARSQPRGDRCHRRQRPAVRLFCRACHRRGRWSVQPLHHGRRQELGPVRRPSVAVGSRSAGSRLLLQGRRTVGGAAQRVRRPHREDVCSGGLRRPGRCRRPR